METLPPTSTKELTTVAPPIPKAVFKRGSLAGSKRAREVPRAITTLAFGPIPEIVTIALGLPRDAIPGRAPLEWRPRETLHLPALPDDLPPPFSETVRLTHSIWTRLMTSVYEPEVPLSFPRVDLGLYFVNRQVGWGLYTLSDIPPETRIGLYGGEVITRREVKARPNKDYFYSVDQKRMLDAGLTRSLMGFILHAPTKAPISLEGRVAVANVEFREELYKSSDAPPLKLPSIFTTKKIAALSPIFIDYGDSYWPEIGIEPLSFDRETGGIYIL
ncbi:MAG: SET domain-containing protein [Verrucomicrobia bacterium]|nr:SET domain-containing protein [Verrucomicrobiota bacterium]